MEFEYKTISHWDEEIWEQFSPIYFQAFGEKGTKPKNIIRNMFEKQLCSVHLVVLEGRAIAFALTGKITEAQAVLIDYIAVQEQHRNKSIGYLLIQYIEKWATRTLKLDHLLIEVESKVNNPSFDFWKKCGFSLTHYIHHYIWVPEPYQAMYKNLSSSSALATDGETLFSYISNFHKRSFTKK